jgi:hypothetical protein
LRGDGASTEETTCKLNLRKQDPSFLLDEVFHDLTFLHDQGGILYILQGADILKRIFLD